jgi:hypothetical protein
VEKPTCHSDRKLWAVIYWIVFGVLFAIIVAVRARPGGMYREIAKGHDRCAFCQAKIKWVSGAYGTVCPKCGETQPR